jgi:hypothetical protein
MTRPEEPAGRDRTLAVEGRPVVLQVVAALRPARRLEVRSARTGPEGA